MGEWTSHTSRASLEVSAVLQHREANMFLGKWEGPRGDKRPKCLNPGESSDAQVGNKGHRILFLQSQEQRSQGRETDHKG